MSTALARTYATAQLSLPGEITRTGWRLPAGLSEEQWQEAGGQLGQVEGSLQWWIGDWWTYGHRYGDRAALYKPGPDGVPEAERLGLPEFQTCANCASVCRTFETSRRREVLSFTHHAEVSGVGDPGEADRLLDWCEEGEDGRPRPVRELRAAVQERNRRASIGRIAEAAWPQRRYPILLADPPWRYEHPSMGGGNRAIENHYPTMDLEEICALRVADIAADDATLYLWATAPKLPECIQVLDAWGFEYRTHIVWAKDKIGMGYHARSQHELLLIAKRGSLPPPAVGDRISSIVYAERGEHSAKPEVFHDLIEGWYPDMPRIELFAREPRAGWDAWGNQAGGRE